MSSKLPFGESVTFAVGRTNSELNKKYKGEKRAKAQEALSYAHQWLATRPPGFNLNQSQDELKKECEEYVKDKFRQSPPEQKWLAEPDENGPVGFAILGMIIVAIIGWVIRKLLDNWWNNVKV